MFANADMLIKGNFH